MSRRRDSSMPDEVRAVLESGRLAHMTTINPDGSPQVSCVWIGLEDDEIVMASLPRNQKVRNLQRDPRVAISVETGTKGRRSGLDEYLVVHGRARVVDGGAPELLQRLAYVYMGPGVRFPAMADPPAGYVVRIQPLRFGGHGPWAARR